MFNVDAYTKNMDILKDRAENILEIHNLNYECFDAIYSTLVLAYSMGKEEECRTITRLLGYEKEKKNN